ncbi:MAG: hypothetical protein LBG45_03045 [Dysgonamonadaceae bacterium]|jgi:hypothetical protein|nr:hypothetical protein [Dysgonamonadaceae bacterium]
MMPIIFTTGAFLQPMKVITDNGKEQWIWTVSEFIDDSYKNGEIYNPNEYANNLSELLENTTAEMFIDG